MIARTFALSLALAACNPLSCGPPANPEVLGEGRARWIFRTAGTPTTPLPLEGGDLVVGTSRGKVHRLGRDGREKWIADAGAKVGGLAVSRDGRTIYAGVDNDCGGAIDAFDAAKGTKKWERPTPGRIAIPVVLPDGSIFVGGGAWIDDATDAGAVWTIRADGTPGWRLVLGKKVALAAPAVGPDGTIAVPMADGIVFFLTSDGREWGEASVGGMAGVVSMVALPSGGFAALSPDALAVFDPHGSVRSYSIGGHRGRIGVAANGTIFSVDDGGMVTAFDSEGRVLWRRSLLRTHGAGEERHVTETPIDVVGAPDGGAFVVLAKDDAQRLVALVRLDAGGHVRWREKLVGIPLALGRPVAIGRRVLVPAGHWNTGFATRGGKEIGHQRVTSLRDTR